MKIKSTHLLDVKPAQVAQLLVDCSEEEFKALWLKVDDLMKHSPKEEARWKKKGRYLGKNPGLYSMRPIQLLYKNAAFSLVETEIEEEQELCE